MLIRSHFYQGYDVFHILRGLEGYDLDFEKIKTIGRNMDRHTAVTIGGKISLRDSREFLVGSLDTLATTLYKSLPNDEAKMRDFHMVMKEFGIASPADPRFSMLMAKGVYPYEYMDSEEKLEETHLPPRESFWSELRREIPEEKDYERACKMFDAFGCKNLRDYTTMYVKLDVLLLATLLELFRKVSIPDDSCGLDPCHFITAPSFSWACMLFLNFKKGTVIENMTDPNMVLMVKRGIRGGMTQVRKRGDDANLVFSQLIGSLL